MLIVILLYCNYKIIEELFSVSTCIQCIVLNSQTAKKMQRNTTQSTQRLVREF